MVYKLCSFDIFKETPQTSQLLAKSTIGTHYTSTQPATFTSNGSIAKTSPPPPSPPRTKAEVKSYHDDSDEVCIIMFYKKTPSKLLLATVFKNMLNLLVRGL